MRHDDGALVLTDPFYADGPHLYGSILSDRRVRVALAEADAVLGAERRGLDDLS
jgi:hypothetical protein